MRSPPSARARESKEGIDFDDLCEQMFEDIDFEWLYDPVMDGIERDAVPDPELGIGNLAFRALVQRVYWSRGTSLRDEDELERP